jgi:hypothetical protein
MKIVQKKDNRIIFRAVLILSYIAIFIFNVLTPYMSDDYSYGAEVHKAHSLADLVRQEHIQYMTWTGRSVVHMILRIFLSQPRIVFVVCSSAVFVLLTMLIYWNTGDFDKKRYDTGRLVLITLLLWLTGVDFAQTVLWEIGACNYMWGSVIILSFVTLYRYRLAASDGIYTGVKAADIFPAAGMALFGVIAGWCNENTSGGGLLLTVCCLFFWLRDSRKEAEGKHVRPWMVSGIIGQTAGLMIMVLAPGNRGRASQIAENHTGLYGMVSRLQKITLVVRNEFFWILAACILCYMLCRLQGKKREEMRSALMFFAVAVLTSYAMCMSPVQQDRAFFGAGIFFMIALVRLIGDVRSDELWITFCKKGAVYVLLLYFMFVYIDCGAENMRIYRECSERVSYIEEQKAAGNDDITVPQIHKEFANRYTAVYGSELKADPGYWTNGQMEAYYGVKSIRAVPYDEWEKDYKNR